MNLGTDLLCLLACLTAVTCDRVYVHPFYLFSFNKSTCEELESLVQEGKKTFVPVSIESQTTPAYEDDLNDRDKLEAPSLSGRGRQKLSYVKDFVYILGMRFYNELREARRGQNVLLSPTSLYGSLVSFYLGASNQTAADLQGLLGFVSPSGDPDCTSRVDGHKVLSSLRMIENLVKSRDEELIFSKTLCLFSAPGVPLSQLFVQDLLPSADALYARAVDFTNPSEAAKQIKAFVEAKSEGQSKCVLTDIDPSADLLFAVDVRLAGTRQHCSFQGQVGWRTGSGPAPGKEARSHAARGKGSDERLDCCSMYSALLPPAVPGVLPALCHDPTRATGRRWREMASKKFSLSRKLRIRKGVGRGIREDCAAFLTAKELKVMRGLHQK